MQPGAEDFVARAHDLRLTSRPVLAAQWHWLRRRPRRYLATWGRAILGNARSPKFLARTLAVVPLGAAFARRIEDLDIDHVHAHWATHPALAAWVIGRLTGRTYSFTAHAHDIYVERPFLDEKLRGAAFAVTISDYNLRLLTRLVRPARRPGRGDPLRRGCGRLPATPRVRARSPARRPRASPSRSSRSPRSSRRRATPSWSRRPGAWSSVGSRSVSGWSGKGRSARPSRRPSRPPAWPTRSCSSADSHAIGSPSCWARPTSSSSPASCSRAARPRASRSR